MQHGAAGEMKPPPSHFKSKVWAHCGFFVLKVKGELDMSKAVCRLCRALATYCGNATDVAAHLARRHPEVNAKLSFRRTAAASQRTLREATFLKKQDGMALWALPRRLAGFWTQVTRALLQMSMEI